MTNVQYREFVSATGHEEPRYWDSEEFSQPDQPVVDVDWYGASEYAEWAGKRLPTEREWKKAAYGLDGREYPWGPWSDGEPDETLANFNGNIGKTTSVGKYPEGISPYGCLDMAGNVNEWCADSYDDKNEIISDKRVLCGGSWDEHWSRMGATFRWVHAPFYQSNSIGFRCVQDI